MYAVFESGGKQHKVRQGELVHVEKIEGNPGEIVTLESILLVSEGDSIHVGSPTVEGARVTGEIVEQGKARKIVVLKKKRRKGYRRKQGHRQQFTCLKIKEITVPEGAALKVEADPTSKLEEQTHGA